ncbi:MAG: hypothetical protein ACLTW0_01875 [Alistipes ihumii]|jgi:hypothetical protein|nr:hypothetical protein [Alistipes ihumii]
MEHEEKERADRIADLLKDLEMELPQPVFESIRCRLLDLLQA